LTLLADSFLPYLSYLIYGQIALIALAIFVGGLLILRRLIRKQPADGGVILEKERLAAEIDEEVRRLTELRDRLDSSFRTRAEGDGAMAASPIPRAFARGENTSEPAPAAVINGISEEDAQKRINEAVATAVKPLNEEIAALKDQLSFALAATKAAPGPDLDVFKSTYESKIDDLSKRLQEYTAFEDEIALVKKLKTENETLKKQIESGAAPTIDLSEDDIAGLFAEMGEPMEPETTQAAAVAAAPEPLPAVTVEPETLDEDVDPNVDGLLAELSASQSIQQSAPEEEVPVEVTQAKSDFESEKTKSEPGLMAAEELTEDTAEAFAELGGDDELMAEFEKVLGSAKEGT
jgi:hypothetical protein